MYYNNNFTHFVRIDNDIINYLNSLQAIKLIVIANVNSSLIPLKLFAK